MDDRLSATRRIARRTADATFRGARRLAHLARKREPADDKAAHFPLTELDRRYLMSRYDDRQPLPPGARDCLRPDNPRLRELQQEYSSFDSPAVEHSQWNAANVAGYLDLQYFRGDSMIQWHYRELPRATRLKLYVYLTYLERDDDENLFSLLGEDGLFGCWTYDFEGHPRVSRDLLESVNELRFLNRHLALFQHPAPRVLDIGAGYGRLAHRMVTAMPRLRDYCCVDAVPESTFLCEYYLRFRECLPPARVLPLPAVETLEPGSFDLALNIHSFSECTHAAVSWWVARLRELEVPLLFVIPNEPQGLLSRERDHTRQDLLPVLHEAGYRLEVREPVVSDPAVRDVLRLEDHFHIYRLA